MDEMITLETTQNLPLTLTEDGMIRVTGSRVSLEAVVYGILSRLICPSAVIHG